MAHVIGATGLQLKETNYQEDPKIGEFIHFASKDSTAPPGKLRLLLASDEDVRKVYAALHGQTIMVGRDRVGIVVGNDLVDSRAVPGNGQRGRA